MTITSNEADRLMDFAAFIYLRNGGSPDIDEATNFAREMFKEFCTGEGITDVCTNEDECPGFCSLCDHWDECQDIDNDDELDDSQTELGFNPYIGGYDYDC